MANTGNGVTFCPDALIFPLGVVITCPGSLGNLEFRAAGIYINNLLNGGGGGGDVSGPASSVDGYVVLFDGASGKLLKQGTGPLGSAAYLASTAFDAAGSAAAAQAASQPLDAALTALSGGSDFVQFTGPSGTVKVFTLPNSNATLADTSTAQTLTNKRNTPRVVAISYAASITPNSDTTDVLNVGTITGTLTVNTPSGTPTDGQTIRFRFVQDSTGYAITFDSGYAFGSLITSSDIPSTASAKFEVLVEYVLADLKWRIIAYSGVFT